MFHEIHGLLKKEYGEIISIAGNSTQCIAQADEIVILKLSISFCISSI